MNLEEKIDEIYNNINKITVDVAVIKQQLKTKADKIEVVELSTKTKFKVSFLGLLSGAIPVLITLGFFFIRSLT